MEKYGFDLIHRKGKLIDYWLREHCESVDIHSFAIIDPSKGDAYTTQINARYPEHFVQTTENKLFTIENARRSFDILNNRFSRQFPDLATVQRRCTIDELKFKQRLESTILPAYANAPSVHRPRSSTSDL